MKTVFTVVPVLLVLVLSGCATTAVKPSGQMIPPYYKPLSGWDQEILAKYTAGSLEDYAKQELKQMGFLQAYHEEFPEPYRAVAYVSSKAQRTYEEWDVAEKEAEAAEARLETAKARRAAQKAKVKATNLSKATGLDAAEAVAAREKLATLEAAVAAAEDDFNEKKRLEWLGVSAYNSAHYELVGTFASAGIAVEYAATEPENLPGAPGQDKGAERRKRLHAVAGIVKRWEEEEKSRQSRIESLQDSLDAAARTERRGIKKRIEEKKLAASELDSFGLPMERAMAQRRNEILSELMVLAEAVHDARDHQLFFTRESSNIFFDTIQIAATGVASVTGSQHAARSLSAFATGIAGIQESVDKRLFFQQTTVLLLQLMQADRNDKEKILLAEMAKPVDQYPLEKGLDDYAAFLTAGGLVDAIKRLSEEAAMKSREANQSLEALRQKVIENKSRLQEEQDKRDAEKAADKQKLYDLLDRLVPAGTGDVTAE